MSVPTQPRALRRGAAAAAMIAGLAVPSGSRAAAPPWAVESPGGAGASVAAGLDGLYDDVDRLTIGAAKTTVTLRDPNGGVSVERVDGDPALLNRKFKVGWKLHGVGGQLPLALPRFHLGRSLSVYPSFVLQVAEVETTLSTRDLREPDESRSLAARGPLVGGTLGVVVPFCRSCRGFAVAGFRYRLVPRLSVSGSQPLDEPGFQMTRDEIRSRQMTSELSLRIGSLLAHDRIALSLGVVGRRTQMDVHDKLGFRNEQGEDTFVDTRTRYDRHATGAIAEVDAHLAGPWYGHAEMIVAGSDRSALLKVAYLLPWRAKPTQPALLTPPGAAPPGQNGGSGRGEGPAYERSPEVVAAAIAGPLKSILDEYRARAAELARADPPYPRNGVSRLFGDTERELIAALDGPELIAMRDFVIDLFARARGALDLEAAAAKYEHGQSPLVLAAVFHGLDAPLARSAQDGEPGKVTAAKTWIDRIDSAIERMLFQAKTADLVANLCIESEPRQRAQFTMHPVSYVPPKRRTVNTNREWPQIWRGLYAYRAEMEGFKTIESQAVNDQIDLVMQPVQTVICRFVEQSDRTKAQPCDQDIAPRKKECR